MYVNWEGKLRGRRESGSIGRGEGDDGLRAKWVTVQKDAEANRALVDAMDMSRAGNVCLLYVL